MSMLRKEIETVLNRSSAENVSDTPDFVLAEYLIDSLAAFDKAVRRREEWYSRPVGNGAAITKISQTADEVDKS